MADRSRGPLRLGWLDELALAVRFDREQRRLRRVKTPLAIVAFALGFTAFVLTLTELGGWALLLGPLVTGVTFTAVHWVLQRYLAGRGRRLLVRYTEAFHARDLDAVRAFHRAFAAQHRGGNDATGFNEYDRASELILEARWSEARDRLRGIDPEVFPHESGRVMLLNNLAYVTALAGESTEAIPMARDAMQRAEVLASVHQMPLEYVDFTRGTLGIALSLAGEHEEAIEVLGPLVEVPAAPSILAVRAYHLGESLRAVGDHARAAVVFACAEADENGPWAARAKAARLRLSPHR